MESEVFDKKKKFKKTVSSSDTNLLYKMKKKKNKPLFLNKNNKTTLQLKKNKDKLIKENSKVFNLFPNSKSEHLVKKIKTKNLKETCKTKRKITLTSNKSLKQRKIENSPSSTMGNKKVNVEEKQINIIEKEAKNCPNYTFSSTKVNQTSETFGTRERKPKNKSSKTKKMSKLSNNHSEEVINTDEESEEDQEIRNEIEKSSVYKDIQKLLKDNPSLYSGFSKNFVDKKYSAEISEESIVSSDESISDQNLIQGNKNTFKACTSKSLPKSVFNDLKVTDESSNYSYNSEKGNQQKYTLCRDNQSKPERKNTSTVLKNKALEKLRAAKFRFLNEKLYTESGRESFTYFQNNEEEFYDYHEGYNLQVSKWPINPIDKIISSLKKINKPFVIADMGCGDAKIAQTFSNQTVHSFDLVALNKFVTPCNISKVPLPNENVDIVVFCLSLMGTNLKEYLQEAFRITKVGGSLIIAEVESRIPNLNQFLQSIESLGYTSVKKDVEHKLFVFLEFKKECKKKKTTKTQDIILKPCLYKKR